MAAVRRWWLLAVLVVVVGACGRDRAGRGSQAPSVPERGPELGGPTGSVVPSTSATASGGAQPEPTPPPPLQPHPAPWLVAQVVGCTLSVSLELDPLEADVASVALVMAERSIDGDHDLGCTEADVVREIGREVFDALAPHVRREGMLRAALAFELEPPEVRCDRSYALRSCARDRWGRLLPSTEQASWLVELTPTRWDTLVATPSGPIRQRWVETGHVVESFDVETGAPRHSKVIREVDRWVRGQITIELSSGGQLLAPPDRSYWVHSSRAFRPARDLQPGDRLLRSDDTTDTVAKCTTERAGAHEVSELDVGAPDALFLDGFLVKDAGPTRTSDPPETAPTVVSRDDWLVYRAHPESYDCGLSTRVEMSRLRPGSGVIDLVVAPHQGAAGSRQAVGCAAGTAVAQLPRHALARAWSDRTIATHGLRLDLELNEDRISCATPYSVLACERPSPGGLATALSLARYAMSGPTCLAVGTLVDTPRGPVPIERLRRGEQVSSFDEALSRRIHSRIVSSRRLRDRPVATIELVDGRVLRATADHPLYVTDVHGYRPARALRAGDRLLSVNGQPVQILRIGGFEERVEVVDLSVDGPSNYFAAGVLVHNY